MLDALGGVQWPLPEGQTSREHSERRLFEDGRFFHAGGRARFVFADPRRCPEPTSDAYPFTLLTGRGSSSQWHTQTRTGKSEVLRRLYPNTPYVEISPVDAAALGHRPARLGPRHFRARLARSPGLRHPRRATRPTLHADALRHDQPPDLRRLRPALAPARVQALRRAHRTLGAAVACEHARVTTASLGSPCAEPQGPTKSRGRPLCARELRHLAWHEKPCSRLPCTTLPSGLAIDSLTRSARFAASLASVCRAPTIARLLGMYRIDGACLKAGDAQQSRAPATPQAGDRDHAASSSEPLAKRAERVRLSIANRLGSALYGTQERGLNIRARCRSLRAHSGRPRDAVGALRLCAGGTAVRGRAAGVLVSYGAELVDHEDAARELRHRAALWVTTSTDRRLCPAIGCGGRRSGSSRRCRCT